MKSRGTDRMVRRCWSDAERVRLKELADRTPARQIAAEFGRTVAAVRMAVRRFQPGTAPKPDLWKHDEVTLLRELWPSHSAGVIARRLNRSRNAVIGQVHRLRHRDRVLMQAKSSRSDQHEIERPIKPKAPPKPRARPAMPKALPIRHIQCPCSLVELEPINCHWPIGDPRQPGFFFCGAVVAERSKYCAVHRAEAHHSQGNHDRYRRLAA